MIPEQPSRSPLTPKEWRAAFKPRKCAVCGTLVVPSNFTRHSGVARAMKYCSNACNQRAWRENQSKSQRQATLAAGRKRAAAWYAIPENREWHIIKNTKQKQK